jgi:hypothetical protein
MEAEVGTGWDTGRDTGGWQWQRAKGRGRQGKVEQQTQVGRRRHAERGRQEIEAGREAGREQPHRHRHRSRRMQR